MKRLWEIVLALVIIPTLAVAVGQVGEHPLVVPGTELGWESAKLELVLRVSEKTQVKLEVYSPGFDPDDYRSPNELGDERYDKSDTPLKTLIRIVDDRGQVRLRREYGVENHRWHKLIDGALSPGDYLIEMEFFGNGKNALAFKLTADPKKARLEVAPGTMQTYNVHGSEWQYPFSVEKRGWTAPITVGIYDGDGPEELLVRVREPDGNVKQLPTPGNGEWVRYRVDEEGKYSFGFSQPKTARQYTNTVGFKVFLGPIKVNVVDEKGNPVSGAEYKVTGYYDRTVFLSTIPEGYDLVRVESRFGMPLSGRRVLFGPGGGEATYVLRPHTGELLVEARAVCQGESWPVPLSLRVGDEQIKLDEAGRARVELPAGEYPVSVSVPGATVDAPESVRVESGRAQSLKITLQPQLAASLELKPATVATGESALAEARLTTSFPYTLPATLRIELPEELSSEGNPAVTGPLSASRPLTLSLPVTAREKGEYRLRAVGSPCNVSAEAALTVLRPAQISVDKEALAGTVKPGDRAAFVITVANHGDQPGRVRVVDELPAGLQGEKLDQFIELKPGEERRINVSGLVTASGGELVNTVRVYDAAGDLVGQASASVRVEQAKVELTRSLDKRVVVPGEEVKVCLQVANTGSLPVSYELSDQYPDWLEPAGDTSFSGELQPGGSAEHCYPARVRFGPEAEGRFMARLTSNAGNLSAPDTIKRVPLGLEKTVEPQRVLVGGEAEFLITLTNPTDHPVSARLLDTPAQGLGMQPAEEAVVLAAGESRQFRYQANPGETGLLVNKASVFVGDTPASFPAKAALKVLPQLQPRRVSEIKLPFNVEGAGDSLLVAHRPPEGASYRPGSSRLDGKPVAEPRRAEDGRLIWKIPYESQGVLSYTVEHKSALPMLGEPDLTLLAGDRELKLAGDVSLKDYEQARPVRVSERQGMIKEPLPGTVFSSSDSTKVLVTAPYGEAVKVSVNGVPVPKDRLGKAEYNSAAGTQTLAYYGVPLQVGRNLITVEAGGSRDQVEVFRAGRPVELVVVPEKTVADGRTPVKLRIESRDANGFATGMGFVTVESSLEPMLADANLRESGYQVLLKDGRGELVLRPMASPGEVSLKMAKDQIVSEASVYVPGPTRTLWTAQGSITVRYDGALEVGGQARGYVETPLAGGTLQGALGVNGGVNAGSPYYNPDLMNTEEPTKRFPLTGSGTQSQLPLESDDGIAVKYDSDAFSIGYYKTSLSLPGVSGLPTATALVLRTRGDLEAGAFVTLLPSTEVVDEITPDGTRMYRLSHPVKAGSEKVILRRGAVEEELVPLRDYVIDYPTGHITLARPLWPYDDNLVPVSLVVTYAPAASPRDTLAFGAGARYKLGSFAFGLAAASLDRGATWKFGAEASYTTQTFKLTIGYGLDAGRSVITLSTAGRQGALEASGNLRYDGALQGKLRVAARVGEDGKVALEHRGSATSNRSALVYEHRFGSISGGVGLGYEWNTSSLSAIGRVGYEGGGLSLTATHQQSFSVAPSLSTLGFSYKFDSNLSGEGELAYEWGTGLSGTFGLKQKLGPANLSISYALPNASGDGNRARFGIAAPLPLSDTVTLDLSAGYSRNLGTGDYRAAAGAGVRYKSDDISATFGVEGSLGSSGSKVTLRSGAAGRLDDRQTLSFDANYVFEGSVHGRFTLAYAYRGEALQVLTYHRMINEGGTSFEGELAPTWHPSLSFQLRPSAAYRVSLNDPGATLYQIGLGANYYFTPRIGLGGGAYYLWQPALARSNVSFSVEGSFRMVDPVWLNLGYTFGGFSGLTPEARPGVYLRLDLLTGSDSDSNEGTQQ